MIELDFIDEPIYYHGLPPLRIGTDCSGIEAPIQALEQLGIPFVHEWSSDIDKYCIQSIKANYKPKILFGDPEGPFPDGDIRNRDHSTLPDIDLYVCGFPCQPFSQAGNRKGLQDERGNVFWSCVEVIRIKKPKYFILENVRGILWHDRDPKSKKGYGKTWSIIEETLQGLKEYNVSWKVLNTRNFGIPQNRERVYIVGVLNKNFKWPTEIKMKNILDYVDTEDTTQHTLQGFYNLLYDRVPKNAVFIDTAFSGRGIKYTNSHLYTGCINTKGGLYNIVMHRYANSKEYLSLQGFSNKFKIITSIHQLKKQVGNSMSVNVLTNLLYQLINT